MAEVPPTYSETRQEMVQEPGVAPRAGYGPAPAYATRSSVWVGSPGYRAVQIVWFIVAVIETVVGLRVLFKALGANQANGFVQFINDLSGPFVAPFRSIVRDYGLGNTGVLETGSIVGMLIYLLIGYLAVRGIRAVATPSNRPVV